MGSFAITHYDGMAKDRVAVKRVSVFVEAGVSCKEEAAIP